MDVMMEPYAASLRQTHPPNQRILPQKKLCRASTLRRSQNLILFKIYSKIIVDKGAVPQGSENRK